MPETVSLQSTRIFETPAGEVELRRADTGHWYTWPRPSAEELARIYGDDYYASDKPAYFEKTKRELPYWNRVWDLRRHVLETHLGRSGRILDVGCAGGFLLDRFRAGGWEVFGVEPSRRAVEYAHSTFEIDLFCGPIEEFAGSGARGSELSFDAIHASQVLEHLLNPLDCLRRIADLLATGGLVYLEVPNEFNALQSTVAERLGKPPWWIVPRHHLNYFDYDSLAGLCAAAGLVEVDRIATFPMEMFALMGKDYVGKPAIGAEVHSMRMAFEEHLCGASREAALLDWYRALAQTGLGRTACIVARKEG